MVETCLICVRPLTLKIKKKESTWSCIWFGNIMKLWGVLSLEINPALYWKYLEKNMKANLMSIPSTQIWVSLFFFGTSIEPRGTWPRSHIPSPFNLFFYFKTGLSKLLMLALNLVSLCLSLSNCWDYRDVACCCRLQFLITISQWKEPGLLKKLADLSAWIGKTQNELGLSCLPKEQRK